MICREISQGSLAGSQNLQWENKNKEVRLREYREIFNILERPHMNFTLLKNQIWNMKKVVFEVSKSNEDFYLTCFYSDGKVVLDSSNFYT